MDFNAVFPNGSPFRWLSPQRWLFGKTGHLLVTFLRKKSPKSYFCMYNLFITMFEDITVVKLFHYYFRVIIDMNPVICWNWRSLWLPVLQMLSYLSQWYDLFCCLTQKPNPPTPTPVPIWNLVLVSFFKYVIWVCKWDHFNLLEHEN